MALIVSPPNKAWRETNEICAKQTKKNLGKKSQTNKQKPDNQFLNMQKTNNREQKEYTLRKQEKDATYLGEKGAENSPSSARNIRAQNRKDNTADSYTICPAENKLLQAAWDDDFEYFAGLSGLLLRKLLDLLTHWSHLYHPNTLLKELLEYQGNSRKLEKC